MTGDAAKPYVFVSYKREDLVRVQVVLDRIEAAGIAYWRDTDNLYGGVNYRKVIPRVIEKCSAMLFFCSSKAFKSQEVWAEVNYNHDHGSKNCIPICLEPLVLPSDWQFLLQQTQLVSIHNCAEETWLPLILKGLAQFGIHAIAPAPNHALEPPAPQAVLVELPPVVPVDVEAVPEIQYANGDRPWRDKRWTIEALHDKAGVLGEIWIGEQGGFRQAHIHFATNDDAAARVAASARRLDRVLALPPHPAVIPMLDHCRDPAAIVVEPPQGESLTIKMRAVSPGRGSASNGMVHSVMRALSAAVAWAHDLTPPLFHGDLKPANVYLAQSTAKTQIKVAGFGLGPIESDFLRAHAGVADYDDYRAQLAGAFSPLYTAPDRGREATAADDVYSLGVIWHQLLIGDPQSSAPVGRQGAWRQNLLRRGLPDDCLDLIAACVHPEARFRPKNARQLLESMQVYEHRLKSARETPSKTEVALSPLEEVTWISKGLPSEDEAAARNGSALPVAKRAKAVDISWDRMDDWNERDADARSTASPAARRSGGRISSLLHRRGCGAIFAAVLAVAVLCLVTAAIASLPARSSTSLK